MNIQLILTLMIGIAVVLILLRNIYKFFFVKKGSPSCGSCNLCQFPYNKEMK